MFALMEAGQGGGTVFAAVQAAKAWTEGQRRTGRRLSLSWPWWSRQSKKEDGDKAYAMHTGGAA
jgi:hypothetical protein